MLASSGTGISDICFEKQNILTIIINKFKCKPAMLCSLTPKNPFFPICSPSSKVMINSLICIFFQGSEEYISVK